MSLSFDVGAPSNGKYVSEYPLLPPSSTTTCLYFLAKRKPMSGIIIHLSSRAWPIPAGQNILNDIKSFLTTEHFKIAGPILVQLNSEIKKDDVVSLIRSAK
ncbi:hypothetical protein A2U01_0010490 [Trifolium medium]|uniref:Uncharacterized protein n=1 Tax=Trifolium medium TaxID=97028 RepID=A0A392MQ18_9FABA|nr:hypothetical protein [Trifolium medium]